MKSAVWAAAARSAVDIRKSANGFRSRAVVEPIDAVTVESTGVRLVNFSSNDYLGLSHHPAVISAMTAAASHTGAGAGASALITGYTPHHQAAERALADWKRTESAVLLGSGFVANLAAVQTILAAAGSKPVRFLVDKLCHASLIDAVVGTGNYRVFPHNHLPKLKRLLEESPPGQLQVVVTESIFSMDGDPADLSGIAALKQSHDFLLLLDEAHATGIFGPTGSGLAEAVGVMADLSVVTLSKALGCVGGAICGSQDWCDAVVNFGRPYIYSTNLPAPVAAAAAVAIEIARTDTDRRKRLHDNISYVRTGLAEPPQSGGIKIPEGDTCDLRDRSDLRYLPNFGIDSPILPILLGDESTALTAAAFLRDRGLLVLPVRPPTVPRGTSRLRITLSSEHTRPQLDQLLAALQAQLVPGRPLPSD